MKEKLSMRYAITTESGRDLRVYGPRGTIASRVAPEVVKEIREAGFWSPTSGLHREPWDATTLEDKQPSGRPKQKEARP